MSWWWLIVTAGFAGSFHCAAMCGPFVAFYSFKGTKGWRHHAFYQVGRLTSYLALGTLAGTLGRGVLTLGTTLRFQKGVMIAMGSAMILSGLSHWFSWRFKGRNPFRRLVHGLWGWLGPFRGEPLGAGLIGLFSTLLPCGYLYSFVLVAVASANPVKGLAIMAAFWLGTAPMLLGLGFFLRFVSRPALVGMERLTPLFLILIGVLALAGKWMVFPSADSLPSCH